MNYPFRIFRIGYALGYQPKRVIKIAMRDALVFSHEASLNICLIKTFRQCLLTKQGMDLKSTFLDKTLQTKKGMNKKGDAICGWLRRRQPAVVTAEE
jgi:hypothetical protein